MHGPGDERKSAPEGAQTTEEDRAITCRRCGHALARARDRQPLDGAPTRSFVNPHGFVFEIAAFREAAGCVAEGRPTVFWTWFPGHAWQFAACGKCGAHVGWCFTGESRFFGLLVERIAGL